MPRCSSPRPRTRCQRASSSRLVFPRIRSVDSLAGARHGFPDIDLTRFAEQAEGVAQIMWASNLPVLVDADDGYGDAKNVTHTVHWHEAMGVSALFLEDQVPPKRCGHLAGKQVVPREAMEKKIQPAGAARRNSHDLFLVADRRSGTRRT
jgi:2,3-dimethylmalate lyase